MEWRTRLFFFGLVTVAVVILGRTGWATPCCQCCNQAVTIDSFTFKEGYKEVVKDTNDPHYKDCSLGYFIPEYGETYILADGTSMTFEAPPGWTFPEDGDKRYHQAPGGAPGIDIYGWIDPCCKVHLFDEHDEVHAWKSGTVTVANAANHEIQIGHSGGSYDLYLHIDATVNDGDPMQQGDLLGTLNASAKHLHFTVNIWGKYKNPLIFMDKHTKKCVPVPEPVSMAYFMTGLVMMGLFRCREAR